MNILCHRRHIMKCFHLSWNERLLVGAVVQLVRELETSNYPVACSYAARFAMSGCTNYHYIYTSMISFAKKGGSR